MDLKAAMCGRAFEASDLVEGALGIALDQELPEQTALAYRRRANVCEYCADYAGEAAAHPQIGASAAACLRPWSNSARLTALM
jgi:hypothetical protein